MAVSTINTVNRFFTNPYSTNPTYSSNSINQVTNTVATAGQERIPLTKLQILNGIVDHLSSIKAEKVVNAIPSSSTALDALIKSYQAQMKSIIDANKDSLYGRVGLSMDIGTILNLNA